MWEDQAQTEFIRVPPGSGKTFLALLIHNIFTKNGAIVVPQEHNKLQFKNLTLVDASVPVLTMAEALMQQDKFDEFVIDDAEDCILNHGIYKDESFESSHLKCFYQIMDKKKTVLITSSIDNSLEKAIKDLGYIHKDDDILDFSKLSLYESGKLNIQIKSFPQSNDVITNLRDSMKDQAG